MTKLPTLALRRISLSSQCYSHNSHQVRHASLLKRPHRPYTFTQLITLSDGSTFTQRTTSPAPVFKSTKDTRNHPMWQPSMTSLRNVEEDEAGRLRAFREKFGRGWDVDAREAEEGIADMDAATTGKQEDREESLMDLISGYSNSDDPAMRWEESSEAGKKKAGKK